MEEKIPQLTLTPNLEEEPVLEPVKQEDLIEKSEKAPEAGPDLSMLSEAEQQAVLAFSKQRVRRGFHQLHTVFEIRNLLLLDAAAIGVDGYILRPHHHCPHARKAQQIVCDSRDFEIDRALQNPGFAARAAVFSAVSRVNDHSDRVLVRKRGRASR